MARTKRTRKSPAGGTLALFATLALSLGTAIAAAAWLIATHEATGMTATPMPYAYSGNSKAPAPAAPVALASATPTTTAATNATNAATATVAASSPAVQQQAATAAPAPSTPAASSAPSAAGQRAFIDPVTGALRQPEHEELAALAAEAAAAAPARRSAARTANTTAEFGPDGSVTAVVPEDLHTFTVATRGPDGRIVIEHAQGAANAAKLVKANSAKKGPQASVSRAQQKEDRNDR